MRRRSVIAVSIPEILVVLAIIALLIGLLIPIVSRSRARAATIACQSNLRLITQACLNRAAENDGYVGLAGIIDNEGTDPHRGLPTQLFDSTRRRYQYLRFKPQSEFENLKALPLILAEHMSRDGKAGDHQEAIVFTRQAKQNFLRVFQCPSTGDASTARAVHRYGRGVNIFAGVYPYPLDYAFNAGVFGFHYASDSTKRRGRGKFPVAQPDKKVLACDVALARYDALAAFTPTVPGSPSTVTLADALNESSELVAGSARPDVSRHRSGVNIAFADGHVESVVADKLRECVLCP